MYRSRSVNIDPVRLAKVKDINWNDIKPQRGGVIIYTVRDNQVYFGLGIDAKTGDITDFGGGIRYKRDGDAINGSLREFMEESLCVFGSFESEMIQENMVLYSKLMCIIFIHLELDIERMTEIFNQRIKIAKISEMSGMIWITQEQLSQLIQTGHIEINDVNKKLYSRVRRFLIQNPNFYDYL